MDNLMYRILEEYITDMLAEQQLKLGYMRETVRLYIPLESLNRMLGTHNNPDEELIFLEGFASYEKNKAGVVHISASGERFCFALSAEVSEWVHEKITNKETDGNREADEKIKFLNKLIILLSGHDVHIEDVKELFSLFSENYVFERSEDEEFDYLAYFKDGRPDAYRYCFVDEGHHIIYHRFLKDDYEEMYGSNYL